MHRILFLAPVRLFLCPFVCLLVICVLDGVRHLPTGLSW